MNSHELMGRSGRDWGHPRVGPAAQAAPTKAHGLCQMSCFLPPSFPAVLLPSRRSCSQGFFPTASCTQISIPHTQGLPAWDKVLHTCLCLWT